MQSRKKKQELLNQVIDEYSAQCRKKLKENPAKELPDFLTEKEICDAVVCITRYLLGFGARNQWLDLKNRQGKAWLANEIKHTWYYFTKNKHCPSSDGTYKGISPIKHNINSTTNDAARTSALSVIAHTGVCDRQACVAAMLLMRLLPKYTEINLCSFYDTSRSQHFPHAFVVVGHAKNESKNPLDQNLQHNIKCKEANANLLAIDPWVVNAFGVVPLKNYWLRLKSADHALHIDTTLIADNKDYLIHRVAKQLNIVNTFEEVIKHTSIHISEEIIESEKNINAFLNTKNIPISQAIELVEKDPNTFNEPHITAEELEIFLTEPNRTKVLEKILIEHNDIKQLLLLTYEQFKDVPLRPGTEELHAILENEKNTMMQEEKNYTNYFL